MTSCNIPINSQVAPWQDGRHQLIEKITISKYEDDQRWPLASFLDKVKDDPYLSISLTPINNNENQIVIEWNYVCVIETFRYKTRTFNVLLS